MDIKIVSDGSFDDIIEKYNIKTVEELKVYAKVYEELKNRPINRMVLSAIRRADVLEGYYPKDIENLKVNIDKFTSSLYLPFNFNTKIFSIAACEFPTVYQIKHANSIRGVGDVKKVYVKDALKMYQDRIDTLLFMTAEKDLDLDILTRNQEEKEKIVNSSLMLWDLLSSSDNFVWGPMTDDMKRRALATKEPFVRIIAAYNDKEELNNYGINNNVIKKFIRK